MAQRDSSFSGGSNGGWDRRRSVAPHVYRSSRRGSILRFTIPAAIALATAGVAIGVAVAYFSDSSRGEPQAEPTPHRQTHAPTHSPAARATPPSTAVSARSTAPSPQTAFDGHRLNDEGYALLQDGKYATALPLLRGAVTDLVGAGPADPYEAYANYNLGYALLQTDRCAEALGPLETANSLESNPAVDRLLRDARACAPQGS